MCVFSKDALVRETIIASGHTHIAYQNKVTIEEDTVMLMPVPGTKVKFLELEANALSELAEQWITATNWTQEYSRSNISMPMQSETVGQYRVHYTTDARAGLQQLAQPVYPWMDLIEERYKGWSFVLVEMKAGQSIANQPWFVSFEPLFEQYVFVPMLDVHGKQEVEEDVVRNHLVLVHSPFSNTFEYTGTVPQWQGEWDGFSLFYRSGGHYYNGDITLRQSNDVDLWMV